MKTSTAKKQKQELQSKVDMIPARLAWDHVDCLDGLNHALNELACLVADDSDTRVPALLNLLRDQYLALSESFSQSLKPEAAKGGVE